MKFSDEPWAQEAAKLMKSVRDQKFPGLDKPEPGEETPEQLRAQLEAQAAKLKQAEMLLKQMKETIDTKQAEQQAKIATAQLDAETKVRTQESGDAAARELEAMKADLAIQIQTMKDEAAAFRLRVEQLFEASQAEKQRQHEEEMKAQDAIIAESQAETSAAREAENEGGEDEA
jgi:hypothetical protein